MKYFKGRTNRATYWLALAVGVALYAAMFAMGLGTTISEVVLVILAIPRLHDIGRSGWWTAAPLVLEIGAAAAAFMIFPPETAEIMMGLIVLAIAGLIIWLGAIPGNPGENRFGPPPPPGVAFGKAPKPD